MFLADAPSHESSGGPRAEELGFLSKGLQKFPGGIGNRWGIITRRRSLLGFDRTEKEPPSIGRGPPSGPIFNWKFR